MPTYAVRSGNVFRCVVADDPKSACVTAIAHHINDPDTAPCQPGQIFQVAEAGQNEDCNVLVLTKHVMEAGEFAVVPLQGANR